MGVRACACSPVHTTYESVMVAGKYISFHGIHMAYRPADCVSIRGALQLAMDTIVLGYSLVTTPKLSWFATPESADLTVSNM